VDRLVTTARRQIVRLTSTHALADKVRMVLSRLGAFCNRLKAVAEQLSPETIWRHHPVGGFPGLAAGKTPAPGRGGNSDVAAARPVGAQQPEQELFGHAQDDRTALSRFMN